ncbi:MAG: aromatic ring-hydroxylating dioxygenase subunit alpha [Alphaproteobacteria bacterium]|nr:aromatic ring-hydroxylating dioxygenase subunit alpha [Alphaproteobacteria bacterium]
MILNREPQDLFDPALYAAVRLPLAEAETLPAWCYTSERFYQREVERIFMKVWNFIGRADRIPNPGDYFTLEFTGIPLIIVRGDDGKVRAFANSCRHRGALVVLGEGKCRAFKCPYHSWAYALDGSLLSAPSMEKTANFDMAEYGLTPVRLESWGGFIFINFDRDAPDLLTYLGDFPQRVTPYNFDDMVCVRRTEYTIDCNWKIYVENAKEAYHIGTVHRNTINRYASAKSAGYTVQQTEGNYCSTFSMHEGSMALLKGDAGFPVISTLMGDMRGGTTAPLIYPSTYLACTIDCAWYLEIHPLGPKRMKLIHGALFPKDNLARQDFEESVRNYYRRWDITTEEDNVACGLQQRGLNSPFALPGRFSHREPLVRDIDNWVLDQVL